MRRTLSIVLLALAVGPATRVAAVQQIEPVVDEIPSAESVAPPKDDGPFFYFGLPYGSEANAGPLDVILNKGFSVAQLDNYSRRIFDYPYGWGAIEESVFHPKEVIDRWGWGDTIKRHVLPLTFDVTSMSWATNYMGHILEGGITNRGLGEWFDAHGVPLPGVFAALTTATASVLNEAYESPGSEEGFPSMVVDLLLFDPAGVLLFSNDAVARFFSRTLKARIWPSQAAITLPHWQVMNNGNNLILKIPLSPIPGTSIFFRTGMAAQLGFTLHRPDGLDISAAMGLDAITRMEDPNTAVESVKLWLAGGVSVDRNGSLLANIQWSGSSPRTWTVNVYPGVLQVGGGNLGFWFVKTRRDGMQIGISHRHTLGVGLGLGR